MYINAVGELWRKGRILWWGSFHAGSVAYIYSARKMSPRHIQKLAVMLNSFLSLFSYFYLAFYFIPVFFFFFFRFSLLFSVFFYLFCPLLLYVCAFGQFFFPSSSSMLLFSFCGRRVSSGGSWADRAVTRWTASTPPRPQKLIRCIHSRHSHKKKSKEKSWVQIFFFLFCFYSSSWKTKKRPAPEDYFFLRGIRKARDIQILPRRWYGEFCQLERLVLYIYRSLFGCLSKVHKDLHPLLFVSFATFLFIYFLKCECVNETEWMAGILNSANKRRHSNTSPLSIPRTKRCCVIYIF